MNDQLEQQYVEQLRSNPRQPAVWNTLGETRLRAKKVAEARAAFENALRLDPGLAQAHFGLASAHREQGKPADAIASYQLGLAREPNNTQALLDLGVLLAEQKQVDEAVGCWQRVLSLQPKHAQAHHNLGVAMAQKGRPQEAIQFLEQAIALRPDYAEAFFNLSNVLCEQKSRENDRRTEAVERFQQAIRLRPSYVEALYNLGSVLVDLNRPSEAAIWLRQAARIGEQNSGGNSSTRRGDADSSFSAQPHPLTASAYNQLGVALSAQAKYRMAETAYRRSLTVRPDFAGPLQFGQSLPGTGSTTGSVGLL